MTAYATINRVRTETRTAFCPVCRVRWAPSPEQSGVPETRCCPEHRPEYLGLWVPLARVLRLQGIAWADIDDELVRAAQDALLAAREGHV